MEFNFDVDELEDFVDTIADGVYPAMITAGEIRPSANNPTTHLIEFEYQIDGSGTNFDGYKIRDFFVIAHAKENVAKRGKSDLRGLLLILGVKRFSDPVELVGQRLLIKTKVNKEGYANVYDRIKPKDMSAPAVKNNPEFGVPF